MGHKEGLYIGSNSMCSDLNSQCTNPHTDNLVSLLSICYSFLDIHF